MQQNPKLARIGYWLAQQQKLIRYIQWVIILVYALLLVVPVFVSLPDESATLFNHLAVFAGFIFWGIWWPFVLLSMLFFGRLWCGVLCPEGALSELANQHGFKKSIPRWIRWNGWPFVAFGLTTIYGQMISVYQYSKPTLLILGGSTVVAIVIGFVYGKSGRVWCKYLCPVTGVFNLLARLAPGWYQPMQKPWGEDQIRQINNVRCPTLLPLPKMSGAANCLMCGKCGVAKNAIQFTSRSPNKEIIVNGSRKNNAFDSLLIIFGLCGLALGAFQWSTSFWFMHYRDIIDSWFLVHQITTVFKTNAPWWLLTHYPERDDVFSWIYGMEVVSYILLIGLFIGAILTSLIGTAVRITGRFSLSQFNHYTLSLVPLAGCSIFIGLLANTTSILQKYANIGFIWVSELKYILLIGTAFWSTLLAYKIVKRYPASHLRQALSLSMMIVGFLVIIYFWFLILSIWSIKSDSIPWNTLWVPLFRRG
ncbi:MAG: 4Fe-4S binding protein [Proteobacteria bacterium]|nr:4Fe-4S binding protein [Pseudomonadota bacterium]